MIEQLRRSCGGHGYNNYSGLPQQLLGCFRMFTGECDNNLLLQQVARKLVKEVRANTLSSIPYKPGPVPRDFARGLA